MRNSLLTLLSFLVLILIWKLLALAVGAEVILPSPERTAASLAAIFQDSRFWPIVGATVGRGLAGFALSCLLGVIVGLLAGFSSVIFWLLQPLLTVIRTVPVMSIILLALIWFHTDMVPVFVSFLMAFPIICGNTIQGIRSIDRQLVEMARIYQVRRKEMFTGVYLPSIAPYLLAGASSAMGLTWKVIVAAEILSQPVLAIGTQMQLAKIYLETDWVLAWTVVIIIVSFICETVLRLAERKLTAWS